MKNWAGNMQESYFTNSCSDTLTTLAYTDIPVGDSNNWIYVARSFAFDDNVANFGVYKTLHFEGKLETTKGTNHVMLKIQHSTGPNIEKVFDFPSTANTFELDLSAVDWANVQSILFFPNRTNDSSTGAGSGTFTFTDISLRKTAVQDAYNIDKGGYTTLQEVNTYESGDTFAVTKDWRDSGTRVIHPVAGENGAWTISWDKSTAAAGVDDSWAWAQALVRGEGLSAFKKIVFTVTGTKDHTAIFALEGVDTSGANKKAEIKNAVTFTGAEQTVELDIKNLKDGTAVDFDWSINHMVMIHPDGGSTTMAGSITLKSVVFSKEALTEDLSNINIYDGTSNTFAITKGYQALDSGTYSFTYKEDGSVEIPYTVGPWKFFHATYRGANLKNLRTVKISLKGVAGTMFVFKPIGDNKEYDITLTGDTQTVEFDISGIDSFMPTSDSQDVNINMCLHDPAATDTVAASGKLIINSITFATSGNNVYSGGTTMDITNSWVDSGDSCYTVTRGATAGDFSVAYVKNSEWGTLLAKVANIPATLNTITFVIKGTKDDTLMLKTDGGTHNETTVTLTGADDTFTIPMNFDATFIGIIAIPGTKDTAKTGTFEIKSCTLSNVAASDDATINVPGTDGVLNLTKWVSATTGAYTAGEADTNNVVACTYTTTKTEWDALQAKFSGLDYYKYNRLIVNITGATAGKEFLVKIEGGDGDHKVTVAADGTASYDIAVSKNAGRVSLMAEDGTANVSGAFNVAAHFAFEAYKDPNVNYYESGNSFAVTKGYTENDKNTYAFTYNTDGTVGVSATTSGYQFFKTQVNGAGLASMTTLTVKAKAVAGKTLLVKPFDAKDNRLAFTGTEEQTLTIDLTDSAYTAKDFTQTLPILFFYLDTADEGATNTTAAAATFTIDSVVFSK